MGRKYERTSGRLRIREIGVSYVILPSSSAVVTEPPVAAEIFAKHFKTTEQVQELLMAMYLDSRGRLLAVESVYRGTINSALVDSRDVLRSALLLNAVSVLLAHLHPSGDPEPSAGDLMYTRRVTDAARLVSIDIRDHLVLGFTAEGGVRYVSLRERGWI